MLRRFYVIPIALSIVSGCSDAELKPTNLPTSTISTHEEKTIDSELYDDLAWRKACDLMTQLIAKTEKGDLDFTEHERIVWDVLEFWGEVQNGGVDQFLYNPTGDRALQTLDALKLLRANNAYDDLRIACDLFPNGKPSIVHEERQKQIVRIRELNENLLLDDIVDRQRTFESYEDLPKLVVEYWNRKGSTP